MANKVIKLEGDYSPAYKLTSNDMRNWGMNLLKFAAPVMVVFFSLLSQGVPVSKAWPVAVYALYSSLVDLLKKYTSETVSIN